LVEIDVHINIILKTIIYSQIKMFPNKVTTQLENYSH